MDGGNEVIPEAGTIGGMEVNPELCIGPMITTEYTESIPATLIPECVICSRWLKGMGRSRPSF